MGIQEDGGLNKSARKMGKNCIDKGFYAHEHINSYKEKVGVKGIAKKECGANFNKRVYIQ